MRTTFVPALLLTVLMGRCAAGETQLTFEVADHKHPSWCGNNIVHQTNYGGSWNIYNIQSGGGPPMQPIVANPTNVEQRPAFHHADPTCFWVYYQMHTGSPPNAIYQVSLAGPPSPVLLTSQLGDDRAPDVSGSGIVFHSDRPAEDDNIRWMSLNGEPMGSAYLTTDPAEDRWPAYSPDEGWVAFASNRPGNFDIWIMSAAGEADSLRQLTTDPADELDPAWSPSGRWIAFSRAGSGIVAVRVETREEYPITSNPTDGEPAWSPDGNWLAFSRQGAYWHIWKTDNVPDDAPVEQSSWGRIKAIYRGAE